MRKIIFALIAIAISAHGQVSTPSIRDSATDPTGVACTSAAPILRYTAAGTSTMYACTGTGGTVYAAMGSGGSSSIPGIFNVQSAPYSAKGDGQILFDGAMTGGSAHLTSATGHFVAGDVGKVVYVYGSGASGAYQSGTISTFNSATDITLSFTNASGGNISGQQFGWGTNDAAAIQAATTAAVSAGGVVLFPAAVYFDSSSLSITSATYNVVRLTGTAAGGASLDPLGHTNKVFDKGSVLLFTGHPGGSNTQCVDGATTGAIRMYATMNPGVTSSSSEIIELDHMVIEYSDPALGCVINASNGASGYDPQYYIHDNTIQGTMSTAGSGQITEGIWTSGAIEDIIDHNIFAALGAHAITMGNDFGWNVVKISNNVFLPLFTTANYIIEIDEQITSGFISNNTFEGGPNGIFAGFLHGVEISTNWFGDSLSNASGMWLNMGGGANVISGNHFEWDRIQVNIGGPYTTVANVIEGNDFNFYGLLALQIVGSGYASIVGNNFNTAQASTVAAIESAGITNANSNVFAGTLGYSFVLDAGSSGTVEYTPVADGTASKILNNGDAFINITGVYSAAGTALPTCNAANHNMRGNVTDATAPTYNGTYTSGGAVKVPVYCNGTNWTTH